jgi:hypothetical protein
VFIIHPFTFSTCFPNIHPHISFHGNLLLHEDVTRYFHTLICIFLFTKLQTLSQAHQFSINTPFWLQGVLRTRCYIRSWPCCTSVSGESCVSYCLEVNSMQIVRTEPDGWLQVNIFLLIFLYYSSPVNFGEVTYPTQADSWLLTVSIFISSLSEISMAKVASLILEYIFLLFLTFQFIFKGNFMHKCKEQ